MNDCRIYRRASNAAWVLANGEAHRGRRLREWVAVCPHCEKVIRGGRTPGFWDQRSTRKNTKDALHRHVTQHHS